jgi:predicted PurR-regulated permease PerM
MIWLIYTLRPLIEPLIIAALVAYILNPLVRLVQSRTRLGHKWSVSLVYFSGLALLIIIPSALAPIAIRQVRSLSGNLAYIETQLETALTQPLNFAGLELHLGQILADFLEITTASLTPAAEGALTLIETTSLSLVWLLVIVVSVYYLLLDWEGLRNWLIRLVPETVQPDVERLLREMDLIWQAYLRGTLVLMLIVGIVFTIVWLAIGLPGAVALGILTGVLTVIPEVGPTMAAILAVLVAFFQGSDFLPISDFWFAVMVFGIYFVLIQIKSIWLRPRIMGRFLNMNEGLIFVAIIAAAVLWGILGALIIVPLLATFSLLGRYIRCRLLHLEPWPEPQVTTAPPIVIASEEEVDLMSATELEQVR